MAATTAAETISLRTAKAEKVRRFATQRTVDWCRVYQPEIKLPDGNYVPFEPYAFEADVLDAMDAGGPVIVNKARQIGLSTTVMLHTARELIERPGITVIAISRKEKVAQELIAMARLGVATCKKLDKPDITIDNKAELGLSNGARVIAETASEEAGRVFTAWRLIFDEFAHLPWQEEMWRSARPIAEATGNVILLSTPNGEGDEFERQWSRHVDEAKADSTGEISRSDTPYRAFRLPWWLHLRRDEAWKATELQGMTLRDFRQEYCCDFLASGETVFPAEAVTKALGLWPQVAARAEDISRRTAGCDVAGEGRDETVYLELDASAHPYGTIDLQAWDMIPGPTLQAHLQGAHADRAVELAIDYTGVGYGIAQNLTVPHLRVTFTGGAEVTGDHLHARVPRHALLSNAVQMLENSEVALDPERPKLLRAVRTARWEKKRGEFVDRLDAWLLALWVARQGKREMRITRIW